MRLGQGMSGPTAVMSLGWPGRQGSLRPCRGLVACLKNCCPQAASVFFCLLGVGTQLLVPPWRLVKGSCGKQRDFESLPGKYPEFSREKPFPMPALGTHLLNLRSRGGSVVSGEACVPTATHTHTHTPEHLPCCAPSLSPGWWLESAAVLSDRQPQVVLWGLWALEFRRER